MPSWEQFKAETDARADELRAEVDQKIKDIEQYYKDQFAKAQEAAISERPNDVGLGETTDQFRARIAAVPGAFSDRAQSAVEVITTPKILASADRTGVPEVPVIQPSTPPSASTEESTIISAPVSEQGSVSPEPQTPEASPSPASTPESSTNVPSVVTTGLGQSEVQSEPSESPEPETSTEAPEESTPAA